MDEKRNEVNPTVQQEIEFQLNFFLLGEIPSWTFNEIRYYDLRTIAERFFLTYYLCYCRERKGLMVL